MELEGDRAPLPGESVSCPNDPFNPSSPSAASAWWAGPLPPGDPPGRLRSPGWASKARVGESGRKRGPEPLTGRSGKPPSRSGLGPEPTPHEHPAPLCLQPPPSRIAVTLTPPLGGLKGHWLRLWGAPRPHMTAPWCLCPSGLQGGLTSHPAAVPRCSRPACRAVPAAPAGQGSHMRPPRVTWASRAGQPEAAC